MAMLKYNGSIHNSDKAEMLVVFYVFLEQILKIKDDGIVIGWPSIEAISSHTIEFCKYNFRVRRVVLDTA